MACTIKATALDKLVHSLQEVRVRSLHDIENTLKRALWENAEINVNAAVLFKNLIRWFGHVPLCEEVTALELMSLILETKHGDDVVKFFSEDRIIKELNKIRYLIGSNVEYDNLVRNLIKQVEGMKKSNAAGITSIDIANVADGIANMNINLSCSSTCASISSQQRTVIDSYVSKWKGDTTFYTECWETPNTVALGLLERFNESLLDEVNDDNFERGLNFVIPYIKDYPPEFFLQPPYVGLSLLHLIQTRRVNTRQGFSMMLYFVDSLRKRSRQRILSVTYMPLDETRARTQVSIGAFVYELFQLCIDQLKELSSDVDQPTTNVTLMLLNQTTNFLTTEEFAEQQKIPAHRFGELCSDFGYLVKHYRQLWESDTKKECVRSRYRITLQIMLDFVRLWQNEPDDTSGTAMPVGTMVYNASDFATLNSTAHQKALEEADGTWRYECLLALLDYPLMMVCPEMFQHLCTYAGKANASLFSELRELKEKLTASVQLLRDDNSKLSNTKLTMLGSQAIDSLFLHKSVDLVRMVLKVVGDTAGSLTEDGEQMDVIESIVLRLLTSSVEEVRSVTYEMCTNMMKDFFTQLDEGAILTRRSLQSDTSPKLRAMGMPLSLQIVTEITCFGYTSPNPKIRQCAETMLLFICNSKAILRNKFTDIQEIILQIAPLVQTVSVGHEETNLRKTVIGLFHPDFGLPWLDILKGNLLLLFHEDADVREVALPRVLFLLSTAKHADRFMPRIEHIADTVWNDVCLITCPFDIGRRQTVNVYEVSTVQPLLDTLENEAADPALRRSALTQLNVMADDPVLCELIHNTSGWVLVLQALHNSLLADHHADYPDAAIPAIGILTKLCFSVTVFRRYLGSRSDAYQLIVRALLAHHHMPVFRVECCALLYLLLFAECATGNGSHLYVPVMCAESSYKLPFVTSFQWSCSPFREFNKIEQLLEQRWSPECEENLPALGNHVGSILRIDGRYGTGTKSDSSTREYVTRYIRYSFADLWYGGLEKILKMNFSKSNTGETEELYLEYKGKRTVPDFSDSLRLTKRDVRWWKVIDFSSNFRKCIRRLGTAKAHLDVYNGLATLEIKLIFPMKNTIYQPDVIIGALKRYVQTAPSTMADQEMLVEVFSIVGIMLNLDCPVVRDWLLGVLAMETNCFIRLLRSEDCIEQLYTKNALLLQTLLQIGDTHTQSIEEVDKGTNSVPVSYVWAERIYITALEQLVVMLKKCDLSRVISLLEILETLSGRAELLRVDIVEVLSKLLQCIGVVGSMSYNGSTIVRSCLLSIAHLMERAPHEAVRFKWDSTTLKTIAIQCSNSNVFARSFAWNILAKVALTHGGAEAIVVECAFLPGGIHASCITTLLDNREACLVRESAVGLLVNLFGHKIEPLDGAVSCPLSAAQDFTDTVIHILAKQRFFETSVESLAQYTCMEYVIDNETATVVSADLVHAYALLYHCLLQVDSTAFGQLVIEKGCLQSLIDCVELQAMVPYRAVCVMVAEVCLLLLRCLEELDRQAMCTLFALNQPFIESVVYLLNPFLYGKLTHPVMQRTLWGIMLLLCALVVTPSGMQQVHFEFGHHDVKPIVQMMEHGIMHKSKGFQMICFKFLSSMIHTTDMKTLGSAELLPFLEQLETMNMNADAPESPKRGKVFLGEGSESENGEEDTENTNPNRPATTVTPSLDEKRPRTQNAVAPTCPVHKNAPQQETLLSGSAFIFKALISRFELYSNRVQLEAGCVGSTPHKRLMYSMMQTMLHFSDEACRVARVHNLLGTILDRFDALHDSLIGRLSYAEFVRKNGDTKRLAVMCELKELSSILAAWFSVPGEPLLLQADEIHELCRILLLFWPWCTNHHALQMEFLQVLAFLSESHIIVCKALASTVSGFPHSIMKLLIVTATAETAKVKGPKCDLQLLKNTLRVLRNCCCCHEGRNTIGKLNVFENISKLHPSVTKLQKPWLDVTQMWLEFWEVYTRYIDVSEVRHLTVLGALVRKSDLDLRLLALTIVRNLTFVASNRPALLASSDYMFMLQNALQRTACRVETLMAAVTVWKMIANNQRGKAAIKSSPLVRLIAAQVKHYSMTPEGNTQNELWNVLMTVYRILGA